MRRWWLERFTLEEIRELAGAIWTSESDPQTETSRHEEPGLIAQPSGVT
jgi:hypothetical protein